MTCRVMLGNITAIGACVAPCPDHAGSSTRGASGTPTSPDSRAFRVPSASPVDPRGTGRSTGALAPEGRSRAPLSTPTASQQAAPAVHIRPKRVPSTSLRMWGCRADQPVTPAASAASSTTPTNALNAPTRAVASSARRRRRTKASDAARQGADPPASSRRAGSQIKSRNATAPAATAIAPNCRARAAPNATEVATPVLLLPSSWATVSPGAAPGVPIENTKPPETMCPSAETTRYVAV